MYRVGLPFWRFIARAGIPLFFRVDVFWDADSGSFWAKSDDLDGLVVEGATRDELRREALSAASALLEVALNTSAPPIARARFSDDTIGKPA